jgi:hypothetical protein
VYNVAEQLKAEPVVKEELPMKMEDAFRINDCRYQIAVISFKFTILNFATY